MGVPCLTGTYVAIPGTIVEGILPRIGRDSLFWWDKGSLCSAISSSHTYSNQKPPEQGKEDFPYPPFVVAPARRGVGQHEENCGARTKESWSAKIEVDARTKFDVVPATVEITRMEDHYE